MGFQTSYSQDPAIGAAGRLVRGFDPHLVISGKCTAAVPYGRGVVSLKSVGALTDDPDGNVQLPPNVPAADVDAFIAGGFSTAGIQTYTADGTSLLDFDGAPIGKTRCTYGRPVQATFNSHADWDATTMEIWGLDVRGRLVYDTITIPDAGNATVVANQEVAFAQLLRVKIPAQSGTNGTFTLGVQGAAVPQQEVDLFGVALLVDANTESTTGYAIAETGSFLRRGVIWVTVENAVSRGQQAHLRHTSDGGSNTSLGTWRGDWDAGRAACVPNARFITAASAAGLAQLEVY